VCDELLASARRGTCQAVAARFVDIEFSTGRDGSNFAELAHLLRRTLTTVTLQYCTVTAGELEALAGVFDLRDVRLQNCFVQLARHDNMLQHLGSATTLRHFESHGTSRQIGPRLTLPTLGLQVAELPASLRVLVLGGQTVTPECARALPRLARLQSLRVARFERDEDLAVLRRLESLETLAVGGIESEAGYAAIGDLRALRRLSLWWHADESVAWIAAMVRGNGSLVELDLSPGLFTMHRLPAVAGAVNLRRLVVRGLALDDEPLVLDNLPRLATLCFSRCRFAPSETLLDQTLERVPSVRHIQFHATIPKRRTDHLVALRERYAPLIHVDIDVPEMD
jgi:hypothetical protein